jgi:asparagine synthase (glutamine-hydrolysing)
VTAVLFDSAQLDSAARRLAESYRASPDSIEALAKRWGGLVVLDCRRNIAVAVMPPIGARQLYWRNLGGALHFCSSPLELAVLGGTPSIDPDAIYRYMYFHMIPGPASLFVGVRKLEGGHRLQWSGMEPKVERYWQPRFVDEESKDESACARELRAVLREAVRDALLDDRPAGAFLSGGLDSSAVAGLAADERPGIHTVSMGFDAVGYDEMEYARIAACHFRTSPLEYYVRPEDIVETLPTLAAAFAEPFGNSSAAAVFHCARVAREHGIELLLAGDGGDELFGGNERYAWQLVFERYARVPGLVRRGLLEPAVFGAKRLTAWPPVRKAASYIEQAHVPLPDRLQAYNFLHRHAPAEIFSADCLQSAQVAEPLRLLREEYAVPTTTSAVNRMLFLDWKFTLHDNDLVKVGTMCRHAGVDVVYPILDQRVIDFSLGVPGSWKVRNGQLRWFYRRAMRDFLPGAIIDKTKHGFGLPFGVWTRGHEGLRKLSEDALASLAQRGYFRPEFLEGALRLHREGHAAYYGELVWILMVLELWLRQHAPAARLDS